jgi:hypothetical protein
MGAHDAPGRPGGIMVHGDGVAQRNARLADLRERRRNFPDRDGAFAALAEAIVWCAKLPAETLVLESTARARRPMADVVEDEEQLRVHALEQARASALDLENGLRLAREAAPAALALDSRDPAADRLAGVLISILVASDFAAVRTDDLGDEQYLYTIAVDWPALDDLAVQIGLAPVTQLLDRDGE